jgi:hypothetical protein
MFKHIFKFKNTFKGFHKDIGKIKKIYHIFFSKTSEIANLLQTVRHDRYDYSRDGPSKFDLSVLRVLIGFGTVCGGYYTAKNNIKGYSIYTGKYYTKNSDERDGLLKHDTTAGCLIGGCVAPSLYNGYRSRILYNN